MQQKQDIKGFTLLELIVVVTIVAIVSAVGYPNFMDWRKDREVRLAVEKVSTMLRSINTQAQRGNFAVVQLYVERVGDDKTNFFSRGINQETEATVTNTPGQTINCAYNTSYWRDSNSEVENFTLDIQTQIDPRGTVCFSKDTRHYLSDGALKQPQTNLNVDGRIVNNYIIICSSGAKCPLSKWKDPTYLVEWNRFGNISKYKWNEKRNAWSRI